MEVNVPLHPFCSLWPKGKEVNGGLGHVDLGKKKKTGLTIQRKTTGLCLQVSTTKY